MPSLTQWKYWRFILHFDKLAAPNNNQKSKRKMKQKDFNAFYQKLDAALSIEVLNGIATNRYIEAFDLKCEKNNSKKNLASVAFMMAI